VAVGQSIRNIVVTNRKLLGAGETRYQEDLTRIVQAHSMGWSEIENCWSAFYAPTVTPVGWEGE